MLEQLFVATLSKLVTEEGTALDNEALADPAMTASIQIRDNFVAWLAWEVDKFELVAQVAIHDTSIESIVLARWTATRLI